MPQVINTNISSLNAQRNLNKSQSTLSRSLQRLSTGLRVNSAKDDAAGLAISERMTAQIRGLNQAVRNANDGVSLAQTAEGSLQTVSDSLLRIRELAIQSANATNSGSDRQALQAEVNQLLSEIQRVSDTTEFNGLKLFDGGFSSQNFQVGSNANQTIGISIEEVSNTTLFTGYDLSVLNSTAGQGTGSLSTYDGVAGNFLTGINAQTLTFNSASGSQTISVANNASAKTIAASINAVESTNGVTATASTVGTLSNLDFATFSFNVGNNAVAGQGTGGIHVSTGGLGASELSGIANQSLTFNFNGSSTVRNYSGAISAKSVAADITANVAGVTATANGTTAALSGFDFTSFNIDNVNTTGAGALQIGTGFTGASGSSYVAQTLTRVNSDGSTNTYNTVGGESARTLASNISTNLGGITVAAGTTVTLSNIADDAGYDLNVGQNSVGMNAIVNTAVVAGDLNNLATAISNAGGASLSAVVVGGNTIVISNTAASGADGSTAGEDIIINGLVGTGAGAQTIDVEANGDTGTITEAANDAFIATGVLTGTMTDDDYFSIYSDTAAAGGGLFAGAGGVGAAQTVATHQITMDVYQGPGGAVTNISVAVAHELDLGNLQAALDAIGGLTVTHAPSGTINITEDDGDNVVLENIAVTNNGTGADGYAALTATSSDGGSANLSTAGNDTVTFTGTLNTLTSNDYFTVQSSIADAAGSLLTGAANATQQAAAQTVQFNIGFESGGPFTAISVALTNDKDLTLLSNAINAVTGLTTTLTGTVAAGDHTITITDDDGDNIVIQDFTVAGAGNSIAATGSDTSTATLTSGTAVDSAAFAGSLELTSHKAFTLQSNLDDGAGSILDVDNDTDASGIKNNSFSVDVSTQSGAQDVIEIMDAALDTINSVRGNLGALQNRFEAAIGNISNIAENLEAARSRIRDADFASETAELTKAQILQQAGISILGQANALPQNALALLQ